MENSSELIELCGINKVSLVQTSSCSNNGNIKFDRYLTSKENSFELIEQSSINIKLKRFPIFQPSVGQVVMKIMACVLYRTNADALMVGRVHSVTSANPTRSVNTERALHPGNASVWSRGEELFVIKVRWF